MSEDRKPRSRPKTGQAKRKRTKTAPNTKAKMKTDAKKTRPRTKPKSKEASAEKPQRTPRKRRDAPPPPKGTNVALVGSVLAVVIATLALAISLRSPEKAKPAPDVFAKTPDKKPKAKPVETPKTPDEKPLVVPDKVPDKEPVDIQPKADEPDPAPPAPSIIEAPKKHDEELVRFAPEGTTSSGVVRSVVDGDTLHLVDKRKIRLIGINTPEKKEDFCPEATALLRKLTMGKEITLAFDREKKDRYGRTLAYIFVDGLFVNGEIVRQGLAYFYEFKPNTKYSKLILELQQAARSNKRQLWSVDYSAESHYVTGKRSHRFHRPACKRIRKNDHLKMSTREKCLDSGRSPCGDCKP